MNDSGPSRSTSGAPERYRLFTPGPLTTSDTVREAAGVDLGSRSAPAAELTAWLRSAIERIAGCGNRYSAIPLQGSGTFAIEAMLCSLLDDGDHVLIVENGAYSQRMTEICRIHGIRHSVLALDHQRRFDLSDVEAALLRHGDVTHMAAVHFETALGVLNDIDGLGRLGKRHGCRLLVDAISTFGAYPFDFSSGCIAAVALSSNKCLHGLPGLAFVVADTMALARRRTPRTLSLDLSAQHRMFETGQQWRFTPPLQAMLALRQAIREFDAAGGQPARRRRYERLAARLLQGMERIGFAPVIDAAHRAPIITTFAPRAGIHCAFATLNDFLFERGLVIYPTRHRNPDSFRVGVIGELTPDDIDDLLRALAAFTTRSPSSARTAECDMVAAGQESAP